MWLRAFPCVLRIFEVGERLVLQIAVGKAAFLASHCRWVYTAESYISSGTHDKGVGKYVVVLG